MLMLAPEVAFHRSVGQEEFKQFFQYRIETIKIRSVVQGADPLQQILATQQNGEAGQVQIIDVGVDHVVHDERWMVVIVRNLIRYFRFAGG